MKTSSRPHWFYTVPQYSWDCVIVVFSVLGRDACDQVEDLAGVAPFVVVP